MLEQRMVKATWWIRHKQGLRMKLTLSLRLLIISDPCEMRQTAIGHGISSEPMLPPIPKWTHVCFKRIRSYKLRRTRRQQKDPSSFMVVSFSIIFRKLQILETTGTYISYWPQDFKQISKIFKTMLSFKQRLTLRICRPSFPMAWMLSVHVQGPWKKAGQGWNALDGPSRSQVFALPEICHLH